MVGAPEWSFLEPGRWEFSFGFRYMKSHRHFVGSQEQHHRRDEGTQVINRMYLADFAMTYGIDHRTTLTLAIPYVIAERSQTVSSLGGIRNKTSARGLGDFSITGRRWMFDPEKTPDANLSLGLGLKVPTGSPNEVDTFRFRNSDGEPDQEVRTVDQSIQLGDGGFGFTLEMAAYKQIGSFVPYLSGSYLFNPEGTSGVRTYRGRESEAIMSIADQYVARAGVQYAIPGATGLAVGLGGRIEGVPVKDVFGPSDGFRRPGYAISVEPSLAYTSGKNTFSLSVPWAVYRTRKRSVTDEIDDRHGDAAFADWVLLVGWTHRF